MGVSYQRVSKKFDIDCSILREHLIFHPLSVLELVQHWFLVKHRELNVLKFCRRHQLEHNDDE